VKIAFLRQRSVADRYFIEYIDCRSSDGFFQKYRFIFVHGQFLPYHLAIRGRLEGASRQRRSPTDAKKRKHSQRSRNGFQPHALSGVAGNPGAHRSRLFGIDCALDRSGNLVVCRSQCLDVVHAHNEEFPYKAPFVHRIKSVFDEMLRKLAIAA
jgi:hypothetical protein